MSLKNKALGGVKWTSLSTIFIVILQTVQLVTVARVLDSKTLGLIGMVTIVSSLTEIFMDLGISNAIIHHKKVSIRELSSLYWFNILVGFILAALLFFFSPFIGRLFNQPSLSYYIKWLSLTFLIIPFGQQYRAMMQKELEFNSIAKAEVIAMVVGVSACITLVLTNHGIISLVIGQIASAATRTALLFTAGRKFYRPLLYYQFARVKKFISFGIFQSGESIINYFNTNIDAMSIGRLLGPTSLGFYNIAFNIIIIPSTKLNPIITRVMFPLLSKIQDEPERLKKNFYKILYIINLVNFPIFFGLFVTSSNLIEVVFGKKWMASLPLLQILCGVGLLRAIGNPVGSLLMAKGKVKLSFRFNLIKMLVQIPCIIAGAYIGGTTGVAITFLFLQVIYTYSSYLFLVGTTLGPSFNEYLNTMSIPFLMSLAMALVVWLAKIASAHLSVSMSLILQLTSGIFTYTLLLLLNKSDVILDLKHLASQKFRTVQNRFSLK